MFSIASNPSYIVLTLCCFWALPKASAGEEERIVILSPSLDVLALPEYAFNLKRGVIAPASQGVTITKLLQMRQGLDALSELSWTYQVQTWTSIRHSLQERNPGFLSLYIHAMLLDSICVRLINKQRIWSGKNKLSVPQKEEIKSLKKLLLENNALTSSIVGNLMLPNEHSRYDIAKELKVMLSIAEEKCQQDIARTRGEAVLRMMQASNHGIGLPRTVRALALCSGQTVKVLTKNPANLKRKAWAGGILMLSERLLIIHVEWMKSNGMGEPEEDTAIKSRLLWDHAKDKGQSASDLFLEIPRTKYGEGGVSRFLILPLPKKLKKKHNKEKTIIPDL